MLILCFCRYLEHWCGKSLEYLQDSKCVKSFPSAYDRDGWKCPVSFSSDNVDGYHMDKDLWETDIDTSSLESIVDRNVNLCVTLTKRIGSGSDVKLYHKYFCLGDKGRDEAFQTWSRFIYGLL